MSVRSARVRAGTAKDAALAAGRALVEAKARDVVILDVREITVIADYFVISSGTSHRQVRALADKVIEELAPRKPDHIEGYDLGIWVLLDYGDVVVHIFREAERAFYGLERLWGDAPRITFEDDCMVQEPG